MSGYGRSTPRSWRRSPAPRTAPTRNDVDDLEAEAERFRKLAPTLGWCSACGESVDEAAGKLHDAQCPHLPAERRKAVDVHADTVPAPSASEARAIADDRSDPADEIALKQERAS